MSDIGIGKTIECERHRDAIHIAVAPVTAAVTLYPGQDVGIDGTITSPVGIVDPFLKRCVSAGERFYLFLYPGTITSLRHDWTHPAFTPTATNPRSEVDLARESIDYFAKEVGLSYDRVMEAAATWIASGRVELLNNSTPDICYNRGISDFWKNYEIVTGAKVADDHKETFFSCSC